MTDAWKLAIAEELDKGFKKIADAIEANLREQELKDYLESL